jgi:hypothetical protein
MSEQQPSTVSWQRSVRQLQRMVTTPKSEGTVPMYYATVRYKLWVREQLAKRRWSQRLFVQKLEETGVEISPAGIAAFLGKEGEAPRPTNTHLMPAINKVLDAAPPPLCDPIDPLEQIKDRLAERWVKLTPSEKRVLYALFGVEPTEEESLLTEGAHHLKSSSPNRRRLPTKQ